MKFNLSYYDVCIIIEATDTATKIGAHVYISIISLPTLYPTPYPTLSPTLLSMHYSKFIDVTTCIRKHKL